MPSLYDTLARATRQYRTREAVVDGDVRLDYAGLDRRAGGLHAGLRSLGVERGDVVAVLMLNSHRHLACWFALPRGGFVLNDLNIRLAPDELVFILDDCGAVALIVDDAFAALGDELLERCDALRHLVHAGFDDLAATDPVEPEDVGEDTLAGIFYTGGTTGLPKGAMLSHRNLLENAKNVLVSWGYGPGDRYLHAAPMFHLADGASTFAVTWCGGSHVIIPAFDPALVLSAIESERVTRTLLVPTMINAVVNHPDLASRDLASLQRITYGASPMPDELLRAAMGAIDCEWAQAYGMTEAAPLVSFCPPEDHRRGATGEEPHATRLRSAGTPVVGVQVEVRRPDGSVADAGEPGEIHVRGPNVMGGYWNRDEETAAALVGDGWYRSGDAAYADEDGYLYIVDRVKDMIITGGENVYCSEVENALFDHPDVLEVAVFGVPDERWGERVHAAVVLHDGAGAGEDELVEHCRGRIAGYKLPRSIEVHDEPLPKSGAGKILKRELREPHWAGLERQVS